MLRRLTLFCLGLSLMASPLLLAQKDWDSVRKIAEAQHEIVVMLIEKGEFQKVPEAASKVLDLNFPGDKEHLMVDAASFWTDLLLHRRQPQLAQQLLDSAYQRVRLNKSKAALCREKAYVFKIQGDLDAAQKMFEKSVELESSRPR